MSARDDDRGVSGREYEQAMIGDGPAPRKSLTNAAKCAIQCQEPLFRAFLKWKLGEPGVKDGLNGDEPWLALRDKDHAARAARYLLGIKSRRELDTDDGAAHRWSELWGDFGMWGRGYYD